jgi:hypothetical protein
MDEPWQDFGYAKRPKYGAVIQKLRPKWKVELEKTILKEMVIMLTAAHVVARVVDPNNLEHLASAYAGTKDFPDMCRHLGYTSRDEASIHLRESITEYVNSPLDKWSGILFTRIDPNSLPDKKIAARLVAGFVKFSLTVQDMVGILRSGISLETEE